MNLRIKEYRMKAGLSQTKLGQAIGVAPAVVNNWERSVALPRTDKLPALASALGCSISDLFEEDETCSS